MYELSEAIKKPVSTKEVDITDSIYVQRYYGVVNTVYCPKALITLGYLDFGSV